MPPPTMAAPKSKLINLHIIQSICRMMWIYINMMQPKIGPPKLKIGLVVFVPVLFVNIL